MQDGVVKTNHLHHKCLFESLAFDGKYSPTDIDSVLDCGGKIFIFTEAKHMRSGRKISSGQRIALENICDAIEAGGKRALALFALHNDDGDIDLGHAIIHEIYDRGVWKPPSHTMNVRTIHQWALEQTGMLTK